jgi:hypothetical protein
VRELDRAREFADAGRHHDAQAILLDALKRNPNDVDAITALGRTLLATGALADAQAVLEHAVRHGPGHAEAHATLAYAHVVRRGWNAARAMYERALVLDPALAIAHHGLAEVYTALGRLDDARRERDLGLRLRPVTLLRHTGSNAAPRVLLLGTALTGNAPLADVVDRAHFRVAAAVTEYVEPGMLPDVDVVVNAIGEADRCADVLSRAAAIAAAVGKPLINAPERVAATGRLAIAERLRTVPGLVVPPMTAADRETLRRRAPDEPFLVRALGRHSGELFFRVDDHATHAHALTQLPDHDLLIAGVLDTRGADGLVRKYRMLFVGDELLPVHAAVGREWKLHFGSGLRDAAAIEHDRAFLADPASVIGARAYDVLNVVRGLLALDYGGVDFGLDCAGNVLFFEANAAMSAPLPGPDAAYRRAPMERIRERVRALIRAKCAP